ncbi:hypothetical protein VTK26DRAFT_4828 [Humicola hyalothermophila]
MERSPEHRFVAATAMLPTTNLQPALLGIWFLQRHPATARFDGNQHVIRERDRQWCPVPSRGIKVTTTWIENCVQRVVWLVTLSDPGQFIAEPSHSAKSGDSSSIPVLGGHPSNCMSIPSQQRDEIRQESEIPWHQGILRRQRPITDTIITRTPVQDLT